jgi:ribosomal protein L11
VPACKAAPSPAIGQALGALGVNMMVRCACAPKAVNTVISSCLRLLTAFVLSHSSHRIGARSPTLSPLQEFCKAFNKRTEAFKDNTLLPVILTAYTDRSFEFVTKTPPVSWFIKQACGLELGSGLTGASRDSASVS